MQKLVRKQGKTLKLKGGFEISNERLHEPKLREQLTNATLENSQTKKDRSWKCGEN